MSGRIFLALLAALLLLSGCADIHYHLTVNRDGSGAVEMTVLYSDLTLWMLQETGNDPLPRLKQTLENEGFSISPLRVEGKSGLTATRQLDDMNQGLPVADAELRPGVVRSRRWVWIYYDIEFALDPAAMPGAPEKGLDAYILNQMQYEFSLTLPLKANSHNAAATADNGRTLIWNLVPGQENLLKLTLSYWDPAATAVVAAVLLAIGAGIYMRYQKRRKG